MDEPSRVKVWLLATSLLGCASRDRTYVDAFDGVTAVDEVHDDDAVVPPSDATAAPVNAEPANATHVPLASAASSGPRVPPSPGSVAAFRRLCGEPVLTERGKAEIARAPYLQRPTAATSILYRRSVESEELDEVEITEPDGSFVQIVPTRVDPGAPDGLQRRADIEGLSPDTAYCYSLIGLTSRVGFRTPPAPESDTPVRFAVFGDSGDGSSDQQAVRDALLRRNVDLVLHTGDIAYERGTFGQFERNYFQIYRTLIASVPLIPVSGNHEYNSPDAVPYREVFALPENGGPDATERWFSYDWGNVHFVGLDTERVGPEQSAWLDRDLQANAGRWTVVYLHRPPYSSGQHGGAENVAAAFVPVLRRHHVPIVFTGHDHDYERTLPIDGVTYIITGGGGKSLREVGRSDFTAVSQSVWHFVLAEVRADTLHIRAIDETGAEFDSVDITR